jgi:hypothetical protein
MSNREFESRRDMLLYMQLQLPVTALQPGECWLCARSVDVVRAVNGLHEEVCLCKQCLLDVVVARRLLFHRSKVARCGSGSPTRRGASG